MSIIIKNYTTTTVPIWTPYASSGLVKVMFESQRAV